MNSIDPNDNFKSVTNLVEQASVLVRQTEKQPENVSSDSVEQAKRQLDKLEKEFPEDYQKIIKE